MSEVAKHLRCERVRRPTPTFFFFSSSSRSLLRADAAITGVLVPEKPRISNYPRLRPTTPGSVVAGPGVHACLPALPACLVPWASHSLTRPLTHLYMRCARLRQHSSSPDCPTGHHGSRAGDQGSPDRQRLVPCAHPHLLQWLEAAGSQAGRHGRGSCVRMHV